MLMGAFRQKIQRGIGHFGRIWNNKDCTYYYIYHVNTTVLIVYLSLLSLCKQYICEVMNMRSKYYVLPYV